MFSVFANPARFEALSRAVSPWLFAVFVGLVVIGLPLALFFSPADYQQGESVRLMYIHVPAAWLAMGSYTFIASASAVAFIWRHNLADIAARAALPVGTAMTVLALVTGAIWGKPTWGAWWVWDARLTSVLVLLFIYLGLFAVWDAVDDKTRAARYARILALVGFINVPIIKFSVDWWNSLHQPASLLRPDGPKIDASMLWPLIIMIVAYTIFFMWYVMTGVEREVIMARLSRRARETRISRPGKIVRTVSPASPPQRVQSAEPEPGHG